MQAVVDGHASPFSDVESAIASQLIARPDAGGDDDHVHFQRIAVGECDSAYTTATGHFRRGLIQMHADAKLFDLPNEDARAGVIDLARHQARRELDNMRFQPEIERRFGGFQTEKPAADDGAPPDRLTVFNDLFQIGNGPINEHAAPLDAVHGRHEGIRAGGEHHGVVLNRDVFVGRDNAPLAVDLVRPVANVNLNAMFPIPIKPGDHQFWRLDGQRMTLGQHGRTPPAALHKK